MSQLCPLLSLTSCAQLPAQAHVNPCWLLLRDLKPPKEQSLDVTHAPDSDNTSPWRPWSPTLAKGTAGNSSPALEPQILLQHKASLQKETLLQWVSGVTDLASSPHMCTFSCANGSEQICGFPLKFLLKLVSRNKCLFFKLLHQISPFSS